MVLHDLGNSVQVRFSLPAIASYDGFKIRVNDDVHTTLVGGGMTSVVIDGLEANTPYTFLVTSYKGIGGDEAESSATGIALTLGMCWVI